MQTIVSLKDFILTGSFGPVSLGMTAERAIDLLGKPDNDNHFSTGGGALIYAWYEIFYDIGTRLIYGIQNDHLTGKGRSRMQDIYFATEKARVDLWLIKRYGDMGFDKVLALLDRQKVNYAIEPWFEDLIVKFPSGVVLDFKPGKVGRKKVLNGIRHFQL